MNRRDLLITLPVAGVTASLSASAFANEQGPNKVDRLARELSDAINETYGGEWQAVIGSDGDIAYRWSREAPAVRLANAVQNAKEAMAELYGQYPDDQSQLTMGQGVVVLSVTPQPVVWGIVRRE